MTPEPPPSIPDFSGDPSSTPGEARFSAPDGKEKVSQLLEYQQLIDYYQHGRWLECRSLLNSLLASYPDEPELLIFKKDIETQVILHDLHSSEESEKKKSSILQVVLFSFLLLVAVIVAGYTVFYIRDIQNKQISLANQQMQMENMKVLETQARQLIKGDRPQEAIKIVEEIMAISPQYPGIEDLYKEAATLIELDTMYDQAVNLMLDQRDEEALEILKKIDQIRPFFRDVKNRQTVIENKEKIARLQKEGQKAYAEGRWLDFINAYDEIYKIDPKSTTTEIKEQYLYSYLNIIVNMMNDPETPVDAVDQAEIYYRKALALFPQSKQYTEERNKLQELSRKLLVFKYISIARQSIEEPGADNEFVNTAIRYYLKASSLDPGNPEIQQELIKAQSLQSAMRFFNAMNWEMSILQLNSLISVDPNFAGGKLNHLLYESYIGRGEQFLDLGIYLDARVNFEAAENLVFDSKENLLRLYQVQLKLGYTLGGLRTYQDAVSYFRYALASINIQSRLKDYPELTQILQKAEAQFSAENYLGSYDTYLDLISKMEEAGLPYTFTDLEVPPGTNLALLAQAHASTLEVIQKKNHMEGFNVAKSSQTITIPSIH